jgi:hypothetical protein
MPNQRWSDLSGAQKGTVVASRVVQLGLLAAALLSIYRRPAVGPVSYFLFGRRR